MGTIHISISKKENKELVGMIPLCRDSSLEFYCENSLDRKLQDFSYELNMGVELDINNIETFMFKMSYVLNCLQSTSANERIELFDSHDEDIFIFFIERLKKGKKYLEEFLVENDINYYLIEIH